MVKNGVFPLDQKDVLYCSHARGALFAGIVALGLKGEDEVLIPDYICNVVLAPFHEARIQTVYYKVKSDLTPDWEDVKLHLGGKVKAFLMVNYFGFPNDLDHARQFCDDHGLFFFEDNAHGFLSGLGQRPLGSWGDISIFAFHKTLSLPGGAALVINKDLLFDQGKISLGKAPSAGMFFLKRSIYWAKRTVKYPLDPGKLVRQIEPSVDDRAQEYDLKEYLLKMPVWSEHVLNGLQAPKMRQARRDKYRHWLDHFQKKGRDDVRVLFSSLEEGICPYVFPVYVRDRVAFIRAMAIKGVASFAWPYLPHDSKEKDLSQHIVCLSVA